MDLNILIVIACVSLTSLFSLLLINKFFRRKTFEEIIAEKKALANKIYGRSSSVTVAGAKKQLKEKNITKKEMKKDKKRQQKQQQQLLQEENASTDEPLAEEPEKPTHIEFEPEPVILVEDKPVVENQKQSKKRKAGKAGILVNKTENVVIETSAPTPQLNHFEEKPPKDAVELKKQNQPKESKKSVVSLTVAPVSEIVKEIRQSDEKLVTKESPKARSNSKTQQKKEKKEKENINPKVIENEAIGVTALMKLFSRAELNRNEIQILIDYLLNKQQDMPANHSDWSDDIIPKLRKQLDEKDRALAEEQSASSNIQSKLRDLRLEYNNEKSQTNELVKSYISQLTAKKAEIANLTQEMKNLNEKFTIERQQYQVQIHHQHENQANSQELVSQIQQLTERNGFLQTELVNKNQFISELEMHLSKDQEDRTKWTDLLQNHVQINLTLEQKLKESENTCQRLQFEVERSRTLETEKESSKVEIRNLQNALDSTQSELNQTKSDLSESMTKINQLNTKNSEIEKKLQSSANKGDEFLKSLQTDLSDSKDKLQKLTQKNEELTNEVSQITILKEQNNEVVKRMEAKLAEENKEKDAVKSELSQLKNENVEKKLKIIEFEKKISQFSSKEDDLMKQIQEQKEKNNKPANVLEQSMEQQKLRKLFEVGTEAAQLQQKISYDQWYEPDPSTHLKNNSSSSSNLNNNTNSNHNNFIYSNEHSNTNSNSNSIENNNSKNSSSQADDIEKLKLKQENSSLKQEQAQLRAQNDELKKIVTNTENILTNLQTKALEQDATWKDVVRAKNEEIDSLKNSNGVQSDI